MLVLMHGFFTVDNNSYPCQSHRTSRNDSLIDLICCLSGDMLVNFEG